MTRLGRRGIYEQTSGPSQRVARRREHRSRRRVEERPRCPGDADRPRRHRRAVLAHLPGDGPPQFTCDGANRSPPLSIRSPPESTQSFALVVDDPDAPDPPFVHWLLWDLPAETDAIPANVPTAETVDALDGATQGANGTGDLGYVGPCPPAEDPRHTYLFSLYALEASLDLEPGAAYEEVLDALVPVAIARSRYVGQYERAE